MTLRSSHKFAVMLSWNCDAHISAFDVAKTGTVVALTGQAKLCSAKTRLLMSDEWAVKL